MRKRLTALVLGLLLLTACSRGGTIQPYAKAATDPGYFTGLWAHLAAQLQHVAGASYQNSVGTIESNRWLLSA
ncbi:MAG TPA: hypothetical protein VGK74_19055 [Symbiobacteriaceae bacterium]|jgi:hypothetical protein